MLWGFDSSIFRKMDDLDKAMVKLKTAQQVATLSMTDSRSDNYKGRRALIVEDDADILRLAHSLVKDLDFRAVIVDGNDAEQIVNLENYKNVDVAIIDYYMPYLNGLEVAALVEAESPSATIAICSASNLRGVVVPSRYKILPKPITLSDIAEL